MGPGWSFTPGLSVYQRLPGLAAQWFSDLVWDPQRVFATVWEQGVTHKSLCHLFNPSSSGICLWEAMASKISVLLKYSIHPEKCTKL